VIGAPPLRKWDDSELVLLSALEHWSYCPRQCALIHLEQTFDENIYTLQGRMLHESVDEGAGEWEDGVRVERGVPLWSKRLGLIGKADVVEFRDGVPYPVEYKRGPKRKWGHDDLQLCGQAMCLEEMTGCPVLKGAVFHHRSRRRREVIFDESLRQRVEKAVAALRDLLAKPDPPPPLNDARCRHCSLVESCLPSVVGATRRLAKIARDLYRAEDQ
jgi:CRISPR-associated exonuclease Cas4